MRDMDIGEVVRRSGVPASALRYYEEKGLIASQGRRGLRRQYPASVLDRLSMIALGRVAGFSLDEIGLMFGIPLRSSATYSAAGIRNMSPCVSMNGRFVPTAASRFCQLSDDRPRSGTFEVICAFAVAKVRSGSNITCNVLMGATDSEPALVPRNPILSMNLNCRTEYVRRLDPPYSLYLDGANQIFTKAKL